MRLLLSQCTILSNQILTNKVEIIQLKQQQINHDDATRRVLVKLYDNLPTEKKLSDNNKKLYNKINKRIRINGNIKCHREGISESIIYEAVLKISDDSHKGYVLKLFYFVYKTFNVEKYTAMSTKNQQSQNKLNTNKHNKYSFGSPYNSSTSNSNESSGTKSEKDSGISVENDTIIKDLKSEFRAVAVQVIKNCVC
jgi:hypothetical protein